MAKIHVSDIQVLSNPSPFLNPFNFQITIDCMEALDEDLEWRMIYVGSAESEEYDQVLDTVSVGPIPEGRMMFGFEAPPPNIDKIPVADVLGCTVVLLTCLYRNQEFIRIGYYTNNEYTDAELKETPPAQPRFDMIERNILATQPRVTRFQINWGNGDPDVLAATDEPMENVNFEAQPIEHDWGAVESQNSISLPLPSTAQG